ncbi:MAG TPA: tetratricopeptide repeat protein [Nevskiaceae bacterium]|nr:tetratricopeptide repeat protein [Nevskiaceae bacterium]
MATHLDDEEQLENLKQWWKDNWVALALGLAIGFGAIGGWQGWQSYRDRQGEAASAVYESAKKALDAAKRDEAKGLVDQLTKEYSSTPYAAAAALRMAQADVAANDLAAAAERLGWVIDHGRDDGIKNVARLRKARVLHAQGKHDDALKLLDAEPEAFKGLVLELRGDIQLAKGDKAAARDAYEKALAATEEQAANRMLLQQKLDDLAGVKAS